MIKVDVSQFGSSLVSRPAGREAALALQANMLRNAPEKTVLDIDFNKVLVLTPSWADEFFQVLKEHWHGQIEILPTTNPSVELTLKTIGMR